MQVEMSRRRFLQGTVALSIVGASALASGKTDYASGSEGCSVAEGKKYTVPTFCEMCVNKCAAIAHVCDGQVKKLDPNPMFPKSRNMLCARGNAGIELLYDPDRLKYPLIRAGKRGEGKFKRVTWDEAYQYITDKMVKILDEEKDNRSTFGFCAGEGMAEHTFKQFFEVFGSSNWLNHSSVCLQTAVSGYALTVGTYGFADLENAEYVIMAGANRAEAIVTPDTMDLFKNTQGRGTKLIVLDPRASHTALKADKWLAVNPGTDLAFVLALTYVAMKEELYDRRFVAQYFNDFDTYQQHILDSGYTPEWAEKITGIKTRDIYQTARDFMGAAPKAIYYPGRRSTFAKNDFQLRRAQAIFTAMGGGIDTKGGLCYGSQLPILPHEISAPLYANPLPRIEKDDAKIIGGTGSWIAWRDRVADGKTDYPVRGLFVYKQNPMHCIPETEKTRKMFENMDLVVTIDTMPGDTVMMSDVVLPECTYLERTDPVKSFPGIEPAIAMRNKVVEPMYETKPVLEILRGLTAKISRPLYEVSLKHDEDLQDMIAELVDEYKEENPDTPESELIQTAKQEIFEDEMEGWNIALPFREDQEHINEHMVSEYPGAYEYLKKHGVYYPEIESYFRHVSANDYVYYPENQKYYSVREGKFGTPSQKIECKLDSMASKGIDAMPTWHDEYETAVPDGKFRFIFGRHAQFTQASTANNAAMLDLMPENYIWINARKAQDLGIRFGDLLEVSSGVGKTRIKAYPTEKIGPENVFFIHGFGNQSSGLGRGQNNGGSDSMIIESHMEPVYGAAAAHETFVTLRKV